MRILFVSDNFPPEVNAPASRTYEHAREWVRLGHSVQVITCAPNFPFGRVYDGYRNALYARERVDGIDVLRVWTFMSRNEGVWLRSLDFASFMVASVLGSLTLDGVDVVIATSPQLLAAVAGAVIAKLKRVPFVFEVRDLWPDAIVANRVMAPSRTVRFFRGVAQALYDRADALVTVGDAYAAQIRALYRVTRNIDVVPNGVRASVFRRTGQRDAVRAAHGWTERFVVLYLGTLGLSHSLETLVDAVDLLADAPQVQLVFVGDGAARKALETRVRAKRLGNVTFLGQRPKHEVPGFYEAADCCVVPLLADPFYEASYPSKMFEAMALECPIVLSVSGAAAALVREAEAGIVVPPETPAAMAQAIRALAADPARAQAYGRNGRAFVTTHFSREASAQRLLEVLARVSGVGGGGRCGARNGRQ